VAKVQNGIIRIETTTCDAQEVGTGFLVGPELVATVEHVVDGEARIVLKQNGKPLSSATVIGFDPARDLALLKTAKPINGYVFKLADRAPRLGEEVAALGFPLALPLTVTKGSVSGLGRTIPIANVERRQLVQTDAALNPGNSGGPLLATDTGEVVGLVDIGSNFNGISFAVSSQVARPLIAAWQAAPQPTPAATCGGSLPQSAAPQPPANPGVGVPSTYEGLFTSVDRLERCNATATYVYCSAGPSGRAVKLIVGDDVHDLGSPGSSDRGGPSMPEGTSFTTPSGGIRCGSSSRGIICTDLTTNAGFVLGDYQLLLTHARSANGGGSVGVPATYSGRFTSVDRLERCYANDEYAVCSAGPSGKAARLVAGGSASYAGVLGSQDLGGPSMPEGTNFTTHGGAIRCGSSSRGITCTDTASGNGFTIGDFHVHVVNGGVERVH
jgi:hypothetical protein